MLKEVYVLFDVGDLLGVFYTEESAKKFAKEYEENFGECDIEFNFEIEKTVLR